MFKKLKKLIGKENYNSLKKPFVISILDSFFSGFIYSCMFLVLIELTEDRFTWNSLKIYTAIMCVATFVRYFVLEKSLKMNFRTGSVVIADLRIRLGDHIRNLNMGYFNKNSLGMLTNVVTNDLTSVEGMLTSVIMEFTKLIILTVYLFAIFLYKDTYTALVQLVLIGLSLPLLIKGSKIIKEKMYALKISGANLISRTVEYISGLEIFKSYSLTGKKFKRLDAALLEVKNDSFKAEVKSLPYLLSLQLISLLSFLVILVIASRRYLNGTISSADLILICVLAMAIAISVRTMAFQFIEFRQQMISVDKLLGVLDIPSMSYKYDKIDWENKHIVFDNISFSYIKDKPVIKNISFEIKEGEKVALVGESGSGKSTILNLLLRFWDVEEGKITLGGVNIKEVNPDVLMENMAIVFQDVYLLNDTVYENVRMGNNSITNEEIISACKNAHCHEFIMQLPEGYETIIQEGGKSLSGGEKQRISIARAIVKDTSILLFDEATASLDADNEYEIQQSIKALSENKTTITIAHRLNTIKNSDKIIVFKEGRIKEIGSHDELLKRENGNYRKMYLAMERAKGWTI